MEWSNIFLSVLSLLFGGGLGYILTIKAIRKEAMAKANKAESEVKTSELDNVQEAIRIWREMAESLKSERDEYKRNYVEVQKHNTDMAEQMSAIRRELVRLTNINSKMVKLLDKITPENLSEMVDKIKKIHENS